MLERTAVCLEAGSLRRLIPGSQKPLKSRRMLHSAFWTHGGGELQTSPLWNAFARDAGVYEVADETQPVFDSGVSVAGFLDFLYPLGALKSIRQYSSGKFELQDGQGARIGPGRLGQRLYTSLANDRPLSRPSKPIPFVEAKSHTTEHEASVSPHVPWLSRINLIERQLDEKDLIWQHFETLNGPNQGRLMPEMLRYLFSSSRPIDAERSIWLFERVQGIAGQEQYSNAIKAYLDIGNVQAAINLHRESYKKFDMPLESRTLLAFLVNTSQWKMAFDILDSFQRFRVIRPQFHYNIWTAVDNLTDLPDRAREAGRFVDNKVLRSGKTSQSSTPKFATIFISRVLIAMAAGKTLDERLLYKLFEFLQRWNTDVPERYELLIAALLRSGHSKPANWIYQKFRTRTTRKISRRILDKLLIVACEENSVRDMHCILEDWTRFYKRPSLTVYQSCMSAFARLGDASSVHSLWEQYCSTKVKAGLVSKEIQGGKALIYSADELAPLLQVHANRGELVRVKNFVFSMEESFGVKPNIKSWNILLHAHAKLLDVGGAFNQFQSLLNSSTKPDSYTIGTLMGLCVARGDLKQAQDLYEMAELMGIPRSLAMINCLVLGHIQDDQVSQAEKICEQSLHMDLKGSLTRMWNYLLTACALRFDPDNLNRILGRMKDAGVEYDGATYSAILQSLAMLKQPDRCLRIMNKIMKRANINPTSFHYAILMGGYTAVGRPDRALQERMKMLALGIKDSASTRWMSLRAQVMKEHISLQSGSGKRPIANVYSANKYKVFDVEEKVSAMTKSFGREPLNVAYPSAYYSYLMFVFTQRNDFKRVKQLFDEFIEAFPKHGLGETPLRILSALMAAYFKEKNYNGVQETWEIAFKRARMLGQPLGNTFSGTMGKVLPLHQLALATPLSTQIGSLGHQGKFHELATMIEEVEAAGFVLNNKNWNHYVQWLAQSAHYRLAFELCEIKLMDNWNGWALLRLNSPLRSRLPIEVRYARRRMRPPLLRPFHQTLVLLIKVYAVLEDTAAQLPGVAGMLSVIRQRCPKTIGAIVSVPKQTVEAAGSLPGGQFD